MARKDGKGTETAEFPAIMKRFAEAWAKRVGEGDTYDLAEMLEFRATFDAACDRAVELGRARTAVTAPTNAFYDWSWATVGEAAGISKQAAAKRWGESGHQ